ncbi:hypothetical protein M3181_08070 [Mesobacillus maritimus]|uniref:hypothetical protein n=1 Tax=Mesobacillus maritimus TaxID=1643336 RepID=UPI00203FF8A5|nr:hypothetical protein [Mesobacillus maritimus]MCM3668956.1 hypothetical protein [Mesobacillus maritimus]
MKMMKKVNLILTLIIVVAVIIFGSYLVNKTESSEKVVPEKTVAEQVKDSSEEQGRSNVEGAQNLLTKTESQGAVTIEVTLLPEQSNRNLLVFEIAMNTHSVDLNQYDLASLAEISFGDDEKKQNFEWESLSNDSHHMMGSLTWKGELEEIPENLTLILKDIDQISSRTFKWEKEELDGANINL